MFDCLPTIEQRCTMVVEQSNERAAPMNRAERMVAICVGIGFVIPNIAAAALAAVPPADIGKASGILSTSRQVGSVAGVSVGLAIYEATSGAGAAGVSSGVSTVLFAAAVAAAVGAFTAGLRLPLLAALRPGARRVSVVA
jgi:hypothetical protein